MTELDLDALKQGTRAMWARGNYPEIAKFTDQAAAVLVDACAIGAGQEVLDVAAGTGNVAIRAAEEGAAVVASDLTPELIEIGRARSEAEGCDIEWVEADCEDLPFEEGRFECVTSAFGAMFAPRPDVVAQELFRVIRRGNTVGMASWAQHGVLAEMFKVMAEYHARPDGLPDPLDWGVEDIVRERFDGLAGTISCEEHVAWHEFPDAAAMVDWHVTNGGGHQAFVEAVGPDVAAEVRARHISLIEAGNEATDGSVRIGAPYLVTVARKRG